MGIAPLTDRIALDSRRVRQRLQQGVTHQQFARAVGWQFTRAVQNPSHLWHGITDQALEHRHVLRIGDCSWQAIENAHTLGAPGYPAILADRLRSRGIALAFDGFYCGTGQDATEQTLAKCRVERTDAILIQFGAQHAVQEFLPLNRLGYADIRLGLNWHSGRLGGQAHRHLVAPLLRRHGRPMIPLSPERITAGMNVLFDWLDRSFPDTPRVLLSPHPAVRSGWCDPQLLDRAWEIYRSAAAARGEHTLDYRPRLTRAVADHPDVFYGSTGYDLKLAGHKLVAVQLLEWLTDRWALGAQPRVASSGYQPAH